jgi:hypothetical protein
MLLKLATHRHRYPLKPEINVNGVLRLCSYSVEKHTVCLMEIIYAYFKNHAIINTVCGDEVWLLKDKEGSKIRSNHCTLKR